MSEKLMTQEELLQSTIEYYSEDTNRRCVLFTSNNMLNRCFYNPVDANKVGISEGCAIGRFMTEEQKQKTIGRDDLPVYRLSSELMPNALKHFDKNFLSRIQRVHDRDSNWSEDGLTLYGKECVNDIISAYALNMEKL